MNRLLFGLLLVFLAFSGFAVAAEKPGDTAVLTAVIIDKDPKGTNLRDAPKGKVVYTIPLKPKNEMERFAEVYEQRGEWFRVTIAEGERAGWLHNSVLGLRGGATEDGPCSLHKTPSYDAAVVFKPKKAVPLQLIGINPDHWLQVRYTDGKGTRFEGWVPEQCQ